MILKATLNRGGRHTYTALLASLILLPLVNSLLPDGPARRLIMLVATLLVIGSSIHAVRGRGGLFRALLVLAVPSVLLLLFGRFLDVELVGAIKMGAVTVFLGLTAFIVLRDVLEADRISAREVEGALCVYLLVGLLWADLYAITDALDPRAFSYPDHEPAHAGMKPMLYFSFVTMTTLGYGDIVPVAPAARALCWIQAVFGQLYIAVLVARFVALQIVDARRE